MFGENGSAMSNTSAATNGLLADNIRMFISQTVCLLEQLDA